MNCKLALGTANFGLNYGINNSEGKLSDNEVVKILLLAEKIGISLVDTAQAYGDSEKRLGLSIKYSKANFKVVTKLKPSFTEKVSDLVDLSLGKIGVNSLYGVLYHNFQDFINNNKSFKELQTIKQQNRIDKIGFSLYYPSELEFLFNNQIDFDLVQFPYNIFDRRFNYLLSELKERNIEIHTRSVFLQGLVFMNPKRLPDYLKGAKKSISKLVNISDRMGIPISVLCLNYVLNNQFIDKVVIGIDSVSQLHNNLIEINKNFDFVYIMNQLAELSIDDEKIVLPFNWKQDD